MESLDLVRIYLETKTVDDIKLGDLIELSRMKGLYAHWAVYVGDGDVIHLSPPPSKSQTKRELCSVIIATSGIDVSSLESFSILGDLFDIKVRRDRLEDVANGSAIVVNNECDDEMTPYPGAEIVKRAESKLGTNDYKFTTWNCEHFATWCRYGKAVSKQVPSILNSLSSDAFLVQLPGVKVDPPGTLPVNIFIVDNKIQDLLSNWANDRQKTIRGLKALGENIKEEETRLKAVSTGTGAGAIACYLLAPFTFGASLVPAAVLTGTCVATSLQSKIADSRHMKDAQSALDADRKSFDYLKERLKPAQQVPPEKTGKTRMSEVNSTGFSIKRVVAKKSIAAKLARLEKTARFAGNANVTTFPLDVASFVTVLATGSNLSPTADKLFELAKELERDYDTIME